ncbi:Integrase, catalytic core [Corchorus capsularis]|uniref:Integrase, catalytic core n=1 Tax=Corchorus capsularis TaxID=210143 RepID=A0A1R3I800_COCAP|nr:Integrase, catalytic core [Corchorus capsularis]
MAAMKLDGPIDNSWFPNTAASAHMTADPGILSSLSQYHGCDKILIGDGSLLDISHTGTMDIPVLDGNLQLNNVLVVPEIKKNLLSVGQLTDDYPYTCEFSSAGVVIKDRETGKMIAKGSHPQPKVVELLKKNKLITSTSGNKVEHFCDSCQMAKACRLPFILSNEFCDTPMDVIHCDLWGAAPVASFQKFKYYVIFVDEYSRFTWYFPLKHKSDFFQCFLNFHAYVENQFGKKIKVFQYDEGDEFTDGRFVQFLQNNGIKLQYACPKTPEQNGLVECKHRNIVELGLTLLFHSHTPKWYWVEAFGTAIWLINRQPSRVLDWKSPFELLYNKSPDYSCLRVFGSKCFPFLRSHSKNKLEPRSLPCIFLGYSELHKGYRCLHPPSGRVYISRHVTFDEKVFPFKDPGSLFAPSDTCDLTEFIDWFSGSPADEDTLGKPTTSTPLHVSETQSLEDVSLGASSFPDVSCATTPSHSSTPESATDVTLSNEEVHNPDPSVPMNHRQQEEVVINSEPQVPSTNSSPITTRQSHGITKPNPKYFNDDFCFTATSIPIESKSVKTAIKHPDWKAAMEEEIHALIP